MDEEYLDAMETLKKAEKHATDSDSVNPFMPMFPLTANNSKEERKMDSFKMKPKSTAKPIESITDSVERKHSVAQEQKNVADVIEYYQQEGKLRQDEDPIAAEYLFKIAEYYKGIATPEVQMRSTIPATPALPTEAVPEIETVG